MLVNELMTKQVFACRPDDFLSDVARILERHDCGCVPVVDGDLGVVGMVTDRDVCLAAHRNNARLSELSVSSAMSRGAHTCDAADPLSAAEATMRTRRVRRLPVVDASNQLVGVLSLDDLARAAGRHDLRDIDWVSKAEVADTLAVICERPVLARTD